MQVTFSPLILDSLPLASATGAVNSAISNPLEVLWGFVFVLVVLSVLALVTQIIGRLFIASLGHHERKRPLTATAPAMPDPKKASSEEGQTDDDELVAIISAAVHAVISEPHRVISIRPSLGGSGWAAEGRRDISSSHRVR